MRPIISLFIAGAVLAAGCDGSRDDDSPVTVTATSTANAFTGLSTTEFESVVDLDFVDTGRLVAAEIKGRVYILDVDGAGAIGLARSFSLTASPLPAGQSIQQVTALGRDAAYATSPGAERLFLFDPETDDDTTVRTLEIGGKVQIAGGSRPDSAGAAAGEFDPSFIYGAARVGSKLFVTFSNLQSSFTTWNPGAVLVYDLDPADPLEVVSFAGTPRDVVLTGAFGAGDKAPRGAIFTSAYNPQTIIPYTTEGGKTVLLVANTGAIDFSSSTVIADGSIDVIDPDLEEVVAWFPLAGQAPNGLAVARRRLYAGSALFACLSVVDLRGLDALLGAGGGNLAARVIDESLDLPRLRPGTLNFVPDVAASHDGRFVYAVNQNDSSIAAIEDGSVPRVAGQFEVAGRNPGAFTSLTGFVEVRPGVPGKAYTGPDLFAATIFLDEQDETPAGTGADNAIDTFVTSPR